jgi:hypothetical protein
MHARLFAQIDAARDRERHAFGAESDPMRDLLEMRQLVDDAVADYDERSPLGGLPALADLGEATKSVLDAVAGFGSLQQYLEDPTIEEIWISERLGERYHCLKRRMANSQRRIYASQSASWVVGV